MQVTDNAEAWIISSSTHVENIRSMKKEIHF